MMRLKHLKLFIKFQSLYSKDHIKNNLKYKLLVLNIVSSHVLK